MHYHHALALLLIVGSLTGGCTTDALPAGPPDLTAGPTERTPPTTAPANPTPTTDGRVTITFAADNRPGYQPLIEIFEKDNPDIHVQFVELEGLLKPVQSADGGMMISPYLAMREILSGADTVAAGITTEAIRKGWARDLTAFMEADPTFDRDDFYPGTLAAGSYDGKIYLLPRAQHVTLLAYNKALWSARGMPAPRPDWTWGDVKAAAAQLARKRNGTVEVYGLAEWHPGERAIRSELEAAGVDLLATPIEQLRLDEPAIEDALTRVAAMVESGVLYLHPQGSRFDPDATAQLIRGQRVGIWMTGMDFVDRSKPAFEIGLAASPFESVSVDGYLMSSGAQHPEHAWRWLAFLSRQVISPPPDFVSMGVEVPARRSIAAQSGDLERLDAEARAVIQTMLSRRMRTSPRGLEDENDRVMLLLTQALNAIVIERQPVRQALRAAQTALTEYVAQVQLTPQPTPDGAPIVVATPLPELLPGSVTITFAAPRFIADQLREATRAFHQDNPSIIVALVVSDAPGASGSLSDMASSSDCFAWPEAPHRDEFAALMDLQPLIDADVAFPRDDYPPPLLAPFKQATGQYGLPYMVFFRALHYNVSAFDAAGIAHPTAAWTLSDFVGVAQQLTRGADKIKRV